MDGPSNAVVGHLCRIIDVPDLSGMRYEVIEEVGRGGMGTVYLARDLQLDRNVALKVINHDGLGEANILAALEHPGIVPVHDAGVLEDGRRYYAMKFVQGVRLDRYAAAKPPLADLLRVFMKICEPVAFAHAQGVIHRDLKPENIIIGQFGEVLVLDWGIAKRESDLRNHFRAGTRGYMAPECAIDPLADVFSLGRILEFLTSGPKPLTAILKKASAPEPSKRYATVLDLSADVARFLDGLPVTAYRESPLERAARWIGHHKTLCALLLSYLLSRAAIFYFAHR